MTNLKMQTTDLRHYLNVMVEKNASDLYISANAPANMRVEGITSPFDDMIMSASTTQQLAYSVMSEKQIKIFETNMEMDVALSIEQLGRFRINIFWQRGEIAIVTRYITEKIQSIADLNLPPLLDDLIMAPRGLILVVGTTGAGKSTTLAAMINHRNQKKTGHILTIEDPIEYVHRHIKSIVNQREVGLDTLSYANALKHAMREAPDVIMIGEIRDRETMQAALAYAGTGHLCLSTLHATNANQTLDRIINFFPENAHRQLFSDLSMNLRAIISQRLVIGKDLKRLPAAEILLNTPHVSDLIKKRAIQDVRDAMEKSNNLGMQTFDQALYELWQQEKIHADEALHHAESRNNLKLRMRLTSNDAGGAFSENRGNMFN